MAQASVGSSTWTAGSSEHLCHCHQCPWASLMAKTVGALLLFFFPSYWKPWPSGSILVPSCLSLRDQVTQVKLFLHLSLQPFSFIVLHWVAEASWLNNRALQELCLFFHEQLLNHYVHGVVDEGWGLRPFIVTPCFIFSKTTLY